MCGSCAGKSNCTFLGVAGQLLLCWRQVEGDVKPISLDGLRLDEGCVLKCD